MLYRKLITIGIATALLMAIVIASRAQELPKEPITKWVTSDVIYWHKDLPYYVFISDDSTQAGDLLHSKKQKKYSNPAYFDTYGYNYIRTKWAVDRDTHNKAVPEQEIEWPVFVDGTAPTTTPTFTSKSEYLVNGVRYFTKDLIMALESDDRHAGVRSTYYSINDSAYIKYAKPINLNPKDTFKIKYFSVDNVGNYEKLKIFKYNADDYSIKYAIDAYAPETKLITKLIGGKYLGPNMLIEFTSKDRGSGVAFTNYIVDNGELRVYDGPFSLNLPEGPHTLKYFSVDRITNKEEEKVLQFYIDRTGPNVYISAAGSYFSRDSIMYVHDSTKVRLGVSDYRGVKKLAYKLTDDKAYKLYSGPITLSKEYSPRQDLKYFATDSTDNDSYVHVIKLHRDLSPPKIKFVLKGPQYTRHDTIYVSSNTLFRTNNYDSLSGVAIDKMYVNDSLVKSLKFTDQVSYSVADTVIDNIGNKSTLFKVYKCDSEPPAIAFTFSAPHTSGTIYPIGTKLFFSIKDNTGVEGFKIVVNGKQFTGTAFAGPPGDYEVQVTAIDYLGQAHMESLIFSIR